MNSTIYDVGMNNGDDTAYYLHKGYDVVAIEADPTLCDQAKRRFAKLISSGRVKILNIGIAPTEGMREFWISDMNSYWNSFNRKGACKGGGTAHPIVVKCQPFRQVLEEFGTPLYLKVDIEGYDKYCLTDLDPHNLPKYVSIEMNHKDGITDIQLLAQLGYNSFQCVRQNDFRAIHPENVDWQFQLRRAAVRLGKIGRVINQLRYRMPRDEHWTFRLGSSGPFGDDLRGPWLSVNQISGVWKKLHNQDIALNARGLGEWYDIHAKLTVSH